MFATRMCSSALSHGVLRETFVRRGSSASIAKRSPGASQTTTQSPTAGMPPMISSSRMSAARMRQPVAQLGANVVAAAVLRDDASGHEASLGVRGEGRLELVGPAERGQGSIGQRCLLRSGRTWRLAPHRFLDRGSVERGGDGVCDFHVRPLLSLDVGTRGGYARGRASSNPLDARRPVDV